MSDGGRNFNEGDRILVPDTHFGGHEAGTVTRIVPSIPPQVVVKLDSGLTISLFIHLHDLRKIDA